MSRIIIVSSAPVPFPYEKMFFEGQVMFFVTKGKMSSISLIIKDESHDKEESDHFLFCLTLQDSEMNHIRFDWTNVNNHS